MLNLIRIFFAQELATEFQRNFLVSPYSVETILALLTTGARGSTAEELSRGLFLPNDHERINSLFGGIIPSIRGNEHYNLSTANKLFVKDGYRISESFLRSASEFFSASAENVNFLEKAETAANINNWVSNQTNNKIRKLVNPEVFDEYTRLVAVNALYFSGAWASYVGVYDTTKKPFYNHQPNNEVDTMDIKGRFDYYESTTLNATFLRLPYEGSNIALLIVLPNSRDGLAAVESHLQDALTEPRFTSELVYAYLPKFRIETDIAFTPILKKVSNLFCDVFQC